MFYILYRTILDALFPISNVEKELFSLSPEEALTKLTLAPDFSGLAVSLPKARSVFAYKDERVAKLVWNIKYKKSVLAVKIGGYALFQELKRGLESHVTPSSPEHILVVPIPISAKRRRERGYNQCELLVDEMERLTAREGSTFTFEKNLLIRTQHATRQTLKKRKDRLESAQGIFDVNEKVIERLEMKGLKDSNKSLKDIQIVIIDDVITTGSTMHEAIKTLKEGRFDDVRVLSLAH